MVVRGNQQQPATTDSNQQQPWLNLVDGCEGQAEAEQGKGSEGEGSKQAALSRAPFASDPFSVILYSFVLSLEKDIFVFLEHKKSFGGQDAGRYKFGWSTEFSGSRRMRKLD